MDFLRGNKVNKHLKNIDNLSNGYITNYNQLNKILEYAFKSVPKYQNIADLNLSSFPIVTKSDFIENFEKFQSNKIDRKKLHWVSTSGSTGQPFKANQDEEKRNRVIADFIYFQQKFNWQLGEKYVYMRAWTSKYNTVGLKEKLKNYIPIDIVNFDQESKESLRMILKKDNKIKSLIGYASALESFVNYLEDREDHKDMFNIKLIFTVSDSLSESTKFKLEKMFGCPVINRYSNEELGLLAYTEPYSNNFTLNTQSFYFELVNLLEDKPVKPGELGRVVITDLYNHSMPFIRYDTGDLAISNDTDRTSIKTFSSFQGRISDIIYDDKGNAITSPILNNYFAEFFYVKKYQLVQMDEVKYVINLVVEDRFDEKELLSAMRSLLGNNSSIELKKVLDIPNEKNGKYKTIIKKSSNEK